MTISMESASRNAFLMLLMSSEVGPQSLDRMGAILVLGKLCVCVCVCVRVCVCVSPSVVFA